MKVLVACEWSGTIRDAFIRHGYDAYSCDLLPSVSNYGPHYQCDVRELLTMPWDLMIAHPECRYLANSGVRWLQGNPDRLEKMITAAKFFKLLLNSNVPKVCVENPVMHKYAIHFIGRKQDQTIQPYEFGHPESKRTCLWLRGLPDLKPTNILHRDGPWDNQTPSGQNKLGPSKDRAKIRGKTYQGIADAMAEQWGEHQ